MRAPQPNRLCPASRSEGQTESWTTQITSREKQEKTKRTQTTTSPRQRACSQQADRRTTLPPVYRHFLTPTTPPLRQSHCGDKTWSRHKNAGEVSRVFYIFLGWSCQPPEAPAFFASASTSSLVFRLDAFFSSSPSALLFPPSPVFDDRPPSFSG